MYELNIESVHGKIHCVVRDSRLRIVKMWPVRALLGQFDSLYDVAFFLRQDKELPWYMESHIAENILGLKYPDPEKLFKRDNDYQAFDPIDKNEPEYAEFVPLSNEAFDEMWREIDKETGNV